MEKIHKHFVYIVIFLHLAVAVPLAWVLNIWIDEASTLYTTGKGFLWTVQNAWLIEKQAPLYFSVLALWRMGDGSIFFARLFSIICSAFAIKVFFDLASRFFTEKQAKFLTIVFALHPFLFWASLEIRVYALVILLVVLMLRLFAAGYLAEHLDGDIKEHPWRMQVCYLIVSIIALYTNYYLGFFLVANLAALLVMRRFRHAATYFWQMFIVLIAILPLLWIVRLQFQANVTGFSETPNLLDGIRILWGHFLVFIAPTEFFAPEETTTISLVRVWIVRLALLTVACLLVWRKFRPIDKKVILFGTVSAVVSLFLIVAYYLIGADYVSLRHAAVLFVPVFLLAASILVNLLPTRAWPGVVVCCCLLFPYAMVNLYPNFTKRGDWARAAAFIEANEKAGQPIVIFRNYDAITIPYYYHGPNRVLPDAKFFDWSQEASLASENAYREEIDYVISQIPADATEIWMLTRESCYQEKTAPSCRPLENFVEANYTIVLERDFYAEKVRLLRKK